MEKTIDKINNFFKSKAPPNEIGFDILSTNSRCKGFTLAYGLFYKISDLLQKKRNCRKSQRKIS